MLSTKCPPPATSQGHRDLKLLTWGTLQEGSHSSSHSNNSNNNTIALDSSQWQGLDTTPDLDGYKMSSQCNEGWWRSPCPRAATRPSVPLLMEVSECFLIQSLYFWFTSWALRVTSLLQPGQSGLKWLTSVRIKVYEGLTAVLEYLVLIVGAKGARLDVGWLHLTLTLKPNIGWRNPGFQAILKWIYLAARCVCHLSLCGYILKKKQTRKRHPIFISFLYEV